MRARLILLLPALCAGLIALPAAAESQTPEPTATPRPPTATYQFIIIPSRTPVPTNTPAPTATYQFIIIPSSTPVPPTPAQAALPPAFTPESTAMSPNTPTPNTPTPPPWTPSPRPLDPTIRDRRDVSDLDPTDPDVILVRGTVCFDENGDGACEPGETPVRETRVSTVDGRSLTLTDDLGQYALRALAGSGLSVIPPAGYRALTSTLPAGPRADFPLVADRAPALVSAPPTPTPTPSLNTSPLARISELLIYIIIGALIALLILVNLRVSGAIESLRKTQLAIAEQTSRADLAAWRVDLEQRIQREWGSVAGQQIANLLGESIRINDRMGITGVGAEPAPRFAVTDARGRKFIFTTSVASLRELGLIGWRDRVLRVTESGSLSLAQALWDYVATHGQINIVVPRSSPWYMAVRDPARATFDPLAALKRGWALRAIRRAVRHSGPWQPALAAAPAAPVVRAASVRPAEMDFHPGAGAGANGTATGRADRVAAHRNSVSPTALTEEVAPISVDASFGDGAG